MSDDPPLPGPLAGLRILELANETGQFCGKLLGDLGADVVKIEPPGGEPCRHVGPFLADIRRHSGTLPARLPGVAEARLRGPPREKRLADHVRPDTLRPDRTLAGL